MFKHRVTARALLATLTLGVILSIAGCGGLSQQPLAPNRAATLQVADEGAYSSDDSPFTLVLAPKGFDPSKPRLRATKPTEAKSAKGVFSSRRDGSLEVRFNRDDDDDDDDDDRGSNNAVRVKKVTFEVEKGSIKQEVTISMTVFSGAALTDVAVKFTPSGLKFHPPARLEINLQGADRKDLQGLKVYHIEGGKVTEISVKVTGNKKNLTLTLEIPGFSIYSIGDELIPEAGP
jgi:hypothetical protein